MNIVNTLRVPFRFGSLGLSGRKLRLTCDDHYESIQFSPEVTLRLMPSCCFSASQVILGIFHTFFSALCFRLLEGMLSINAFGDKSV